MNFYVFEVKGDRGSVKARHMNFVTALGEIIQRVTYARHCKYAIALPETYAELVQRKLPWRACKRLALEALLVNSKGQIKRFTWKELKKVQFTKE